MDDEANKARHSPWLGERELIQRNLALPQKARAAKWCVLKFCCILVWMLRPCVVLDFLFVRERCTVLDGINSKNKCVPVYILIYNVIYMIIYYIESLRKKKHFKKK